VNGLGLGQEHFDAAENQKGAKKDMTAKTNAAQCIHVISTIIGTNLIEIYSFTSLL